MTQNFKLKDRPPALGRPGRGRRGPTRAITDVTVTTESLTEPGPPGRGPADPSVSLAY